MITNEEMTPEVITPEEITRGGQRPSRMTFLSSVTARLRLHKQMPGGCYRDIISRCLCDEKSDDGREGLLTGRMLRSEGMASIIGKGPYVPRESSVC